MGDVGHAGHVRHVEDDGESLSQLAVLMPVHWNCGTAYFVDCRHAPAYGTCMRSDGRGADCT